METATEEHRFALAATARSASVKGLKGWWCSGWMEHTFSTHSSSLRRCPPPQITVLIGIAHALVIYRVVATALFTQSNFELLREWADTVAVMTGAVLHYITIVIMSKVQSEAWGGQRLVSLLFHHEPTPHLTPLSNRSTGTWPSSSATWVRELRAVSHPHPPPGYPLGPPASHAPCPFPSSTTTKQLLGSSGRAGPHGRLKDPFSSSSCP